ncbi:DUF1456 family protein [Psychrobium sp. 1_MG-2023]|uniref:DUF1456 family protein n=1 Tax=Psychrobium sp. 1_MG-2023 TaxID=3062624 RepID=UPI000C32E184|nr:DUF1456 family protein [Psychrobium sp. 1_MG-2023]MDP2561582.1 DUF1456 family protein [Psychrobium sp. 1_MG-2023]PKF55042.1 DUF1456 domain-containing protein [Alteromonadales bacterium alter-6D02]
MINNLVLRRLRYALNLREASMVEIFKLADRKIKAGEISNLLMREKQEGFVECDDVTLEQFLDGLIIKLRGPRDESAAPLTKQKVRINNNIILKKIRIALELREDDLLEIMQIADFKFSKSEMSAFFRKPGSRQYKPCGDQMIRNFLIGLCEKNRPSDDKKNN